MEETKRRRFIIRAVLEGEVDVSEAPPEPKSDMNGWSDGIAYTDLDIIENEYVIANTGASASYNGWNRTGLVPCDGAANLVFPPMNQEGGGRVRSCWFYGEAGISEPVQNFELHRGTPTTVTVPASAYYFIISSNASALADNIEAGIVPNA